MDDALVFVAAAVVAYVPGLVLLAAASVPPGLLMVALAPAASVAVAGVTAVLVAPVGLPFGPVALLAVTAAVGAAAVAVRLARPRELRVRARRVLRLRLQVPLVVGSVMVAVGVAFASWAWVAGIGPLATRPQEHDMIMHVLQTAYVTRTGRGAPWQLAPVDLLTGTPTWFYPSGVHLLAAATAGLTGGAVVPALNAQTVVLLAAAGCTGAAALGAVAARQLGLGRGSAMLVAGVASLVMAGLYRPALVLMHDGGILANAVSLSLVPAAVAGVLALGCPASGGPQHGGFAAVRVQQSHHAAIPRALPIRAGAGVGASIAGAVWCHPSAAVSIAVTTVAWWAGMAVAPRGRAELRRAVRGLAVAAGVTAVLLVPAVGPGLGQSARTANWPPDTGPVPFYRALGETLGFPYSGWIDPEQTRSQTWVLLLVLVGIGAVVALRRGIGPVAAFAVWSAVVIGAWLSPGTGVDALVTRFFYHAMLRTWSHVYLLAPVLAGLGVVLVADRVAVLARRRLPLRASWAALALVSVAFVGYAAAPAVGYARIAEVSVATRYRTPEFVRIGPDDDAAIAWLAAHIRPGERVFNSPNDGSTYLYVERGIPIVNIYTLGLTGVPYTYRLLQTFDTYPTDPAVRRQLADLDVRWVYVDTDTPAIGSAGSPEDWAGPDGFRLAPGLRDLDGLPGLREAFRSGSVTVYALDLAAVGPQPDGG
ncbi:DUF6541 family protein [Pseudonocardia charpentierae]|uniref:DUF6541 family protein n=1 Tax=Pseudonocardia charpentierae TaxID=3075545 RepID=A0ABU2N525_9PSEU|nr:DUF6541 family protein [Pseudonocardia sp. DSM 45834]MDT0348404.1 DUF6541 family protein [Pseudonocardia sp. DSM 45834]